MKKKFIFSLLFFSLQILCFGQEFTIGNLTYTQIGGTNNVEVIQNISLPPQGMLNIPSSVNNSGTTFSVTKIGLNAFASNTNLTAVTIPNSVTIIGMNAFYNCFALTSAVIGNSVTSIEHGAFSSCTSLTLITIPNSVSKIGTGSFFNCTNLTSVTIPSPVTVIEKTAFFACTGLTSVTVDIAVPLQILYKTFGNIGTSPIPLYVPAGSEALYEAKAVWTDFSPILAIPMPCTFPTLGTVTVLHPPVKEMPLLLF